MALRFDELRNANVRRCEDVFHPLVSWSLPDWATAMAGECGEACNVVKKIRRLDSPDAQHSAPDPERAALMSDLGNELADLVIYADLLAARAGIDLGAAVVEKFNAVSFKRGSSVLI